VYTPVLRVAQHTSIVSYPTVNFQIEKINTLILLSRQEAQAILARCLPFSPFSFAAGLVGAGTSFTSFKNISVLVVIVLGIALFVRCPIELFSNLFIDASCSKRLLIRIDIKVSHKLDQNIVQQRGGNYGRALEVA